MYIMRRQRRNRNTDELRYWYAAALLTSLMLLSLLYVVTAHAWTQYGNAVGGNLDSAVNIQDTLAAVKGSSTITATPGASDVTLSIKGTGFDSLFDTRLGLKSTSDVAEGAGKYYLDSRARAALSGTAPVTYNSGTGVFSMPASDNATAGYLTAVDHGTFSGKVGMAEALTIARTGLSGTAPVTYNSTTGAFSMPASDNATAGYLTAADHGAFSGKVGMAEVAAMIAATPATGGGGGVKNLLINGNMNVWQRTLDNLGVTKSSTPTTTKTNATSYGADRWYALPSGANFASGGYLQSSTVPNTLSGFSAQLKYNTSMTTILLAQRLEAQDVLNGMKQTLTFSCQVYNGTGESITPKLWVGTPGAADNWTTPTDRSGAPNFAAIADTTWVKISATFNPTAYTNIDNGMEVGIVFPAITSPGTTKYVLVTQCQLEVGSTANTIERRTFDEEFRLAQRYYRQYGDYANYWPNVFTYSSASGQNVGLWLQAFESPMRAVGTPNVDGSWATNCQPRFERISTHGFMIDCTSTGAGQNYWSPDSADDQFRIDAEL